MRQAKGISPRACLISVVACQATLRLSAFSLPTGQDRLFFKRLLDSLPDLRLSEQRLFRHFLFHPDSPPFFCFIANCKTCEKVFKGLDLMQNRNGDTKECGASLNGLHDVARDEKDLEQ
jgi:hypothetical protein